MKFKIILILVFTLLLTGCWNYKELNDIAIITSMSIDKNNDEFIVGVGVANTNKSDKQVTIYSGSGNTLSEAVKNIDLYVPKQLYFGHLSVVTINEEVAKVGLNQITDYLLRSKQISSNFFLLISKEVEAKEIIKTISPLETFPSQNISSKFLDINNNETDITSITFSKYLETIKKPGIEPILPAITLEQNNATKLDTVALFKDDKLITFANEVESKGINILLNKIDEMLIPIDCDNKKIIVQVTNIKTKINTKKINIKANGIIKELNCSDKKIISKINENTTKEIKKIVSSSINLSKKYNTDIFGFGNTVYKTKPTYYKKHKIDLKNINPKINVNFKLDEGVNLEKN